MAENFLNFHTMDIYARSQDLEMVKLISFTGAQKPFRVGVHFDGNEVCTASEAANTCEWDSAASGEPGGITGFKLIYWQNTC